MLASGVITSPEVMILKARPPQDRSSSLRNLPEDFFHENVEIFRADFELNH